jgi:cytochrome P450
MLVHVEMLIPGNATDPTLIKDELLSVLLAGRDSTAGLLTFAFYLLSIHHGM